MSNMIKKIKEIMELSDSKKVVIFTNHLKIVGHVADCDKCNEEHFVNLTNVTVLDITELYPCEEDGTCSDFSSQNFEWLHVNINKIIAFSFI